MSERQFNDGGNLVAMHFGHGPGTLLAWFLAAGFNNQVFLDNGSLAEGHFPGKHYLPSLSPRQRPQSSRHWTTDA
jgi:hypothetical protein